MQAQSEQPTALEVMLAELWDKHKKLSRQKAALSSLGCVALILFAAVFFAPPIFALVGLLLGGFCGVASIVKWSLLQSAFITHFSKINRFLPDLGLRGVGPALDVIAMMQVVQNTKDGEDALGNVQVLLAHYLPMLPTDELTKLNNSQRATLVRVTRQAIEESSKKPSQEPLAVAGLLALATLKDRTLYSFVYYLPLMNTRRLVQAAVAEYRNALRP